MESKTLDEAINDYFHSIVRTHPWDKKRFEAALEPVQRWFGAQYGEPAPLIAFTADHIAACLAALPPAERAEAEEALSDLYAWLGAWGWIDVNPITTAV